jgi:hypothetical protein
MHSDPSAEWSALWSQFDAFRNSLSRSKAVNVNSTALRDSARELVQQYFRRVRPELEALQIDVASFDSLMQRFLHLANGRNAKSSYQDVVRALQASRGPLEVQRERLIGTTLYTSQGTRPSSGVENAIAETLDRLVPSAGLSYRQALADLGDTTRISYRGPATDLRECLREVLDHLAPDKEVTQAAGFKLEKDRTRPTMKQKVRFILKSRGLGKTALASPEASTQRIEDSAGVLARSVYNRGSVSTHLSAQREEVLQLKLYVEGVLAELLQIHGQSSDQNAAV